jgi:hypothetical protein
VGEVSTKIDRLCFGVENPIVHLLSVFGVPRGHICLGQHLPDSVEAHLYGKYRIDLRGLRCRPVIDPSLFDAVGVAGTAWGGPWRLGSRGLPRHWLTAHGRLREQLKRMSHPAALARRVPSRENDEGARGDDSP